MKYESATILLAFFGLASAAPTKMRREVPQEKSHNKFLTSVRTSLNLDNPDGIVDPVFGLLGNAAAAAGAGKITNLDCLHQATADRAFTNAKAAGDVQAQVDALIYAALERNTGAVGLKSVLCTDAAVNPEIQALTQHQDPASENAAADNKALVLVLAQEIATLGGDPLDALLSGTFAPGEIGDPTAAGNTCDDDDAEGCIFTQNLLVNDATEDEINAAVAGIAGGAAASNATDSAVASNPTASAAVSACPAVVTATATVDAVAEETASATASAEEAAATTAAASADAATGSNVQTFAGNLGGAAPAVTESSGDRPFSVNGATFVNEGAALQRSCAVQNNACANAVNSGALAGKSVADCNAQEDACNAAAARKTKR